MMKLPRAVSNISEIFCVDCGKREQTIDYVELPGETIPCYTERSSAM